MFLQVKYISIERMFRYFVFSTCLGIVIWQCLRCCTKFISKPQGTKLSIVNSAGNIFPSVTVCPYPDPTEDKENVFNNLDIMDIEEPIKNGPMEMDQLNGI